MKPFLIADSMHPVLMQGLDENKIPFSYQPDITKAEAEIQIAEYSGIIIRSKFEIDKPFIDRAVSLNLIARAGSGMENIDQNYAVSKGIRCINAPEGLCDAVAEHAIGMLLSLLNNLSDAKTKIKQGTWDREEFRGNELMGLTVGIIGYGHTGSAMARKLQGFDCRILAYDKFKIGFGTEQVIESSLNDLFRHSDVISLHIPQNSETICWFNSELIANFKKPFWFINTSRGKIVKTMDLVNALKTEKIKGVCLDVLENENPASFGEVEKEWFNYLSNSNHAIVTPHIAGWTQESYRRISEVLLTKILG